MATKRTCTKIIKVHKETLSFFSCWEKITSESRNFRRVQQTIFLIYLHKKVQLELLIIPHSIQSTQWWYSEGGKEIDSYLCEWIFKQKCKLFWGLSYSDLNSTFASSEESSLREINEWIENAEGKTIEWELSRQGREKICFSFSYRQTHARSGGKKII